MNKNIEDKEFENNKYVKELKNYLELCIEDKDIQGYKLEIDRRENFTNKPLISLQLNFINEFNSMYTRCIRIVSYDSNLNVKRAKLTGNMLYINCNSISLQVLITILDKFDSVLYQF